jgi:hypothetical protein
LFLQLSPPNTNFCIAIPKHLVRKYEVT